MRAAQKEEILECIESLWQAHEEIKEILDKEKEAVAPDMFMECQEFAMALGQVIEKTEGEGHITVSYIEQYCEMLFYVYENIRNGAGTGNRLYKNLKRSLLKVENSVKNDISIKKEIVFFPYKASMWDSLESIYLAAKEDAECDTYCVPIPYYDLKCDHSFGQMHYEGGEYPSNIEIINWQEYEFEKRRPDVVYIHNAYDDWNLVTSIHPRFYSANLKKYTEKLIYVPYFVLGDINLKNINKIEKIKHFCFLPGIIYADKVIVESENIKKIYVMEYLKAAKSCGLEGKDIEKRYLEEKILGIGSPKYDKAVNIKKENIRIPDKWCEIIRKPNGIRKKVIMYNTSISALLQHNEKMLEKIEDTLNIFKENKDEIALLWRPHPLIKSTIASMRPRLWHEYERIVEKYKEESWGIYDDTADFDRAIAISDAYYGDKSSVAHIYEQTGKPIMMQDVYQLGNSYQIGRTNKKWIFSCIKTVGKKTFAFSSRNNGLFLLSEDGKAEFVASIPKEKMWVKNLYIDMVIWQDFLFLIPGKAEAIAKVHTTTYEIQKIEMSLVDDWDPKIGKFVGAFLWEQELILLPEKYPAILRMDLHLETFSYVSIQKSEFCFKKGYYCDGKHVYLPSSVGRFVLKYNLTNNKMERIVIPECGQGIWSLIESDGLKYLVSFPDSNVIWWDEENNKFGTMANEIPEYSSDGFGSSIIIQSMGKLVVFPIRGNYVLEVDKDKGSIKECAIDWKYEKGKILSYRAKNHNLLYFYKYEEKEGLFQDSQVELLELNTDTLELRCKEFEMDDIACILQASKETVFYERYGIELTEFIEFITKCNHHDRDMDTKICGDKIHRELMDEKM